MTRRHFLADLSLPLLPLPTVLSNLPGFMILPENHLLSQESASAYSALLPQLSPPRHSVFLLPGIKRLSLDRALALCRALDAGSSVLIECGLAFSTPSEIEQQRRILRDTFGIQLGSPPLVAADPHHPYVAFSSQNMVRSFGLTFPAFSNCGEPLAYFSETPVVLKTRAGKGTLIFLGAMLGPHLEASDPDARFAAQHILTELIS